MRTRRPQRNRTFFWHGVLIVLPVAVLAMVGVVSLRQDKLIGRHEAEVRAQGIADARAQKLSDEIAGAAGRDHSQQPAFVIDQAGQLIFPPSVEPVPRPKPLNSAELTQEQAQLWRRCQQATADQDELATAIESYEKFSELQPPDNFAAIAQYTLG